MAGIRERDKRRREEDSMFFYEKIRTTFVPCSQYVLFALPRLFSFYPQPSELNRTAIVYFSVFFRTKRLEREYVDQHGSVGPRPRKAAAAIQRLQARAREDVHRSQRPDQETRRAEEI